MQLGDSEIEEGKVSQKIYFDTFNQVLEIKEVNTFMEKQALYIYPNPITGSTLHFSQQQGYIQVYNAIGELMIEAINTNVIDVSNYQEGIYIAKTTDKTFKFVKQ